MTDTLTVKDIKENADNLVSKLNEADIDAHAYARPPAGKDIFIIGNPPGAGIKIWPGVSKVTCKTSKKHRNAVLNVIEDSRTIVRSYEVMAADANTARREGRRCWDVTVPGTAKYSEKVTKHPSNADRAKEKARLDEAFRGYDDDFKKNRYRLRYTVEVTARIPASDTHFLVGVDEKATFIAQLPEPAKTVEEAHKVLRPEGVSGHAKRQGEWFFDPVTDPELSDQITKSFLRRMTRPSDERGETYGTRRGWGQGNHGWSLEFNSSHWATQLTKLKDGRTFVSGYIYDTRESHHSPLLLGGWHEVHRNREVAVTNDFNQPGRGYWD